MVIELNSCQEKRTILLFYDDKISRKHIDSPALVVELKYDKDADTAISQIKRKKYPAKVAQYTDNLLLVGINYDKETRSHSCVIERWGEVAS